MNTSGPAPPAIWVASVARLVSVSVDADTRLTFMFGYCASNALMSTVRASLAPVPDSGLADQTMSPDVVEPTLLVAEPAGVLPPPALVVLLLPQAARVSTVTPARAVSPKPPFSRAGDLLRRLLRDMCAPPGLCPCVRAICAARGPTECAFTGFLGSHGSRVSLMRHPRPRTLRNLSWPPRTAAVPLLAVAPTA